MKNDEQIIGTACRVEFEEKTGKLFLVFEITNEKQKQDIKKNWTRDIEFRLVDRRLVEYNE
jgi:hypothetical protein